jgi:hypothetical protein
VQTCGLNTSLQQCVTCRLDYWRTDSLCECPDVTAMDHLITTRFHLVTNVYPSARSVTQSTFSDKQHAPCTACLHTAQVQKQVSTHFHCGRHPPLQSSGPVSAQFCLLLKCSQKTNISATNLRTRKSTVLLLDCFSDAVFSIEPRRRTIPEINLSGLNKTTRCSCVAP